MHRMSSDFPISRRLGDNYDATVRVSGAADRENEVYPQLDEVLELDLSELDAEAQQRLITLVERSVDKVCTVGRTLKAGTKVTLSFDTEADVPRRSVVAAIALGSVVALSAPAQASVPADRSAGSCGTWTSSVVATGAGMLENLEFDGSGSMVLSQSALIGPGALLKVAPDGTRTTLVGDVTGPGGLVAREGSVYFTTGNSTVSGLFGIADGSSARSTSQTGR